MSYEAKKLTGRGYRITDGYCTELTIRYQVLTPRLTAAPGLDDLTGFPAIGAAPTITDCTGLTLAAGVVLCDVDVSEDDSGIKWTFTAGYKVPSAGGGTGANDPTATQYTDRITHGTRTLEVQADYDLSSPPKPFLNSAGRPYDTPPVIRIPIRVITVEKRYKTRVNVSGVSGTANQAAVTIDGEAFAAGTATLDATCETTGDKKWPWQIRFTVEELYTPGKDGNTGAYADIINKGWEYLEYTDEDVRTLVRACSENEKGVLVNSPTGVLLDEDGGRLPDDTSTWTTKRYTIARLATWPNWVSA